MNYNNPVIELVPDPVALDLAIQQVQTRLATLPWLQKAFGRCVKQVGKLQDVEIRNRAARNEYTYPEVYNNREPLSLMMNDNLNSYCFFHAKDSLEIPPYGLLDNSLMVTQPIAIIFWLNLAKIDPAKNYNFSESLRVEALKQLQRCPDLVLDASSVEYNNVFAPFTITETFRQFLKPPFAAFRFDGTLSFDLYNC